VFHHADLGKADPEDAVDQAEARARRGSAQGSELLAEGEILKGELGTGPENREEGGEEVEKEGEHGQAAHDAKCRPSRLFEFLSSPTEK
jgi:hypothetical protein